MQQKTETHLRRNTWTQLVRCQRQRRKTNLIPLKRRRRRGSLSLLVHGELMKQQVWSARSTWVDTLPPRKRRGRATHPHQTNPNAAAAAATSATISPLIRSQPTEAEPLTLIFHGCLAKVAKQLPAYQEASKGKRGNPRAQPPPHPPTTLLQPERYNTTTVGHAPEPRGRWKGRGGTAGVHSSQGAQIQLQKRGKHLRDNTHGKDWHAFTRSSELCTKDELPSQRSSSSSSRLSRRFPNGHTWPFPAADFNIKASSAPMTAVFVCLLYKVLDVKSWNDINIHL